MKSNSWLNRQLIRAVHIYQRFFSGLKRAPSCRFEPTCSSYALDALHIHGPIRAISLILIRLSKCGPWHPGGFDPVIDQRQHR